MNGRLMTRIRTGSGSPSTFASSIETPVTPPSMNRLDSRNPCSPIPAEKTPRVIETTFNSSRRIGARRPKKVLGLGIVRPSAPQQSG